VWKKHPARAALLALYAEVDALLAPFSCPGSTDCCHFGRTGREPQPHAVEIAEVLDAARGQKSRSLPMAEGRCPMLAASGRCRIYASRPFGCRTYFCDRATGVGEIPRERINEVGRRVAALSARAFPRDPGPRALTKALERGSP
jgi:Fe-S-cluster containining protein